MLHNQPTNKNVMTEHRAINVFGYFEPCIVEIAKGLSNINRYNGATCRPYSVAEHSIRLANHVHKLYPALTHLEMFALLHDLAEYVIGDLIRPVKDAFNGDLAALEDNIITNFLNLVPFSDEQLADIHSPFFINAMKNLDTRMAVTEIEQLLGHKNPIEGYAPIPGLALRAYQTLPIDMEVYFTMRFEQLYNKLVKENYA